jgi:hypothetical protein
MGLPDNAVTIYELCAKTLEKALASAGDTTLSLETAAAKSGYSVDHFGRLIRMGRIPNAGRKGKPRIRVADLPKRPQVVTNNKSEYDPVTDARSLRSRGKRPV